MISASKRERIVAIGAALVLVTILASPRLASAGDAATAVSGRELSDNESAGESPVRLLLDRVVSTPAVEDQQALFDDLISRGCAVVPELGKALGDPRPLPFRYVRLENHAVDAFESYRQYGPETVTDAVAAVLNQLTGQHFGFIYNGASQAERDRVVEAWRAWLDQALAQRIVANRRGLRYLVSAGHCGQGHSQFPIHLHGLRRRGA